MSPTSVGLPPLVGLCPPFPPAGFGEQGVPPVGGCALSRSPQPARWGPRGGLQRAPPGWGVGRSWSRAGCPTARAATPPAPAALGRAGCASQRVPSLLPGSREALGSGVRSPLTAGGPSRRESEGGVALSKLFQVLQGSAQGRVDPRVRPPTLVLLWAGCWPPGMGDLGVQVRPPIQS